MVDIPRGQEHKRRKAILRVVYSIVGLILIAGITYYLSGLEPAAPTVERATVWLDKVERGDFRRQVRGPGTLVPEQELYIPAITQGRVERIIVKPGVSVEPDTVILELSNPSLQRDYTDAKLRLEAAKARYRNLEVQLQSQLLTQQASAANVVANYTQARLESDLNLELQAEGLIDDLTVKTSDIRAQNLKVLNDLEQRRLKEFEKSIIAQLEAQRADLATLDALFELRASELDALRVRPGIRGQLQEVPVEEGQQVMPGANLARVARPDKLMAELRIAETQANEIVVGQKADIDTRNGVIPGHVIRIDPGAQQGVVQVDVALDGELPQGARPQLSVDGTIEIEFLQDVLSMGRPAYGQANSTIGLFKILSDGTTCVRTQVRLGRSSVSRIEIISGLQQGEEVILSDTSTYDSFDRLRLSN